MTGSAWMLRTADGEYGPLDFPVLQSWAAEGRFDGLDPVSRDGGAQWVEAASVPDLGLEWQLREEDGELSGPVHALAIAQRLAGGSARADQDAVQSTTGESFTVGEVAFSALLSQNTLLTTLLEETRQSIQGVVNSAPQMPEALPAAESAAPGIVEWRTLVKEKDFFEREANKWRKFYEDETERNRVKEAELSAMLETAREAGHASISRALTAEENCRRAETKLEQMLVRAASGDTPAGGREPVDSGDQVSQLQEILNGRSEEMATAIAARDQVQAELHRRDKLNEELIRREREVCANQRKQLSRIERSYQELIVSYRAMNDRLIQLQNGVGAGMRKASSPTPAPEAARAAQPETDRTPPRSRIKLR